MLQHMKPMNRRGPHLTLLETVIVELDNFAAFGTQHVIMMLPEMMMLIAHRFIIELNLFCKTVIAQQAQGIVDKPDIQRITVFPKPAGQFLRGHMLLGLQQSFQHPASILKLIDPFLLKKLSELFFFLIMHSLHCRFMLKVV
jgi:hypothetical protein